jgi:hypothetical protein
MTTMTEQNEGFTFKETTPTPSDFEKAAASFMRQANDIFMTQRIGISTISGSMQFGKFTMDYTIKERHDNAE